MLRSSSKKVCTYVCDCVPMFVTPSQHKYEPTLLKFGVEISYTYYKQIKDNSEKSMVIAVFVKNRNSRLGFAGLAGGRDRIIHQG